MVDGLKTVNGSLKEITHITHQEIVEMLLYPEEQVNYTISTIKNTFSEDVVNKRSI